MERIELKNCSKYYIKNNKKIEVLKNINYKFKNNKLYAIMGESGSGKSTLLNLIAGLIKLNSGKIIINNNDISKMNNEKISKLRNQELGLVYQSFLLNEQMTAIENVMLPTYINKNVLPSERKTKAFEILEKLGLADRMNHYPKELSGGEQQRVAIARCLINNPNIILADEPTGNLDEKNEEEIFDILKNISKEGKCVLIVTHNSKIKKYADVILELKDGVLYEKS